MKTRWFAASLALALATTLAPDLADAKRLGGGKSVGMQRQAPERAAPQSPPPQQPAAPTQAAATGAKPAAATAAAAAPAAAKRSWMGPLAGLAAGLGLAALASALGFGEGFANFMMLLLLGLVAFVALRFVLARFGRGAQPALATAGAGAASAGVGSGSAPQPSAPAGLARSGLEPAAAGSAVSVTGAPLRPINIGEAIPNAAAADSPGGLSLPEGFDLPGFERVAKMVFIRMQAASDTADLDDLREFTTPEMFAAVRLELQERGGVAQQTDVESVHATLIDFTSEANRQVASVRFQGLVREDKSAPAVAIDEVWHLVKPLDGSRNWAIAGIQQAQ
jgi:predicted lipid-binding transport protein (Tim44 family)